VTEPRQLEGVKRFDDAALNRQLDLALATIPEGRSGALLVYARDGELRATTAARLAEGWTVFVGLEKRLGTAGGPGYQVAIRGVW
jgi:hypothetical protein